MPAVPRVRAGVTLLELLVVLVLLGLAAALAAPVLRTRRAPVADPLAGTVADARALAVRRAEALRLDVAGDGRWELASRDSVLRRGTTAVVGSRLRLGISPLGVCVPEGHDDGTPTPAWDAGACVPLRAPAAASPDGA